MFHFLRLNLNICMIIKGLTLFVLLNVTPCFAEEPTEDGQWSLAYFRGYSAPTQPLFGFEKKADFMTELQLANRNGFSISELDIITRNETTFFSAHYIDKASKEYYLVDIQPEALVYHVKRLSADGYSLVEMDDYLDATGATLYAAVWRKQRSETLFFQNVNEDAFFQEFYAQAQNGYSLADFTVREEAGANVYNLIFWPESRDQVVVVNQTWDSFKNLFFSLGAQDYKLQDLQVEEEGDDSYFYAVFEYSLEPDLLLVTNCVVTFENGWQGLTPIFTEFFNDDQDMAGFDLDVNCGEDEAIFPAIMAPAMVNLAQFKSPFHLPELFVESVGLNQSNKQTSFYRSSSDPDD